MWSTSEEGLLVDKNHVVARRKEVWRYIEERITLVGQEEDTRHARHYCRDFLRAIAPEYARWILESLEGHRITEDMLVEFHHIVEVYFELSGWGRAPCYQEEWPILCRLDAHHHYPQSLEKASRGYVPYQPEQHNRR